MRSDDDDVDYSDYNATVSVAYAQRRIRHCYYKSYQQRIVDRFE